MGHKWLFNANWDKPMVLRHGQLIWGLWWLHDIISKGLSNWSMRSSAFDRAVYFLYLLFCSFMISSLEFWLVCMEDMFSSHLPILHIYVCRIPFPRLGFCCGCSNFGSLGPIAVPAHCCVVCKGSGSTHHSISLFSPMLKQDMETKSLELYAYKWYQLQSRGTWDGSQIRKFSVQSMRLNVFLYIQRLPALLSFILCETGFLVNKSCESLL